MNSVDLMGSITSSSDFTLQPTPILSANKLESHNLPAWEITAVRLAIWLMKFDLPTACYHHFYFPKALDGLQSIFFMCLGDKLTISFIQIYFNTYDVTCTCVIEINVVGVIGHVHVHEHQYLFK